MVDLDEVQAFSFSRRKPGADKALVQVSLTDSRFVVELTHAMKWSHQEELSLWIKAREEQVKRLQDEQRRQMDLLQSHMKVVMESQTLRERYKFLVEESQALTHREFFKAHEQEIQASAPMQTGTTVDVTALSVCMSAQGAKHSDPGALVGEAEAQAIFKEFPALKQLYAASVPAALTSNLFWSRCLRSRFLLKATGQSNNTGRADPLFDALEHVPSVLPSHATVAAMADDADFIGETAEQSGRDPLKGGLLDHLNQKCAKALQAVQKKDDGGQPREFKFKARQWSARNFGDELNDLEPPQKAVRLHLDEPKYSVRVVQRTSNLELKRSLNIWRSSAAGSAPHFVSPLATASRWVLREAVNDMLESDRLSDNAARKEAEFPQDAAQTMSRAKLLLQHFWSSRAGDTNLRGRLVDSLKTVLATLERWQTGVSGTSKGQRAARSFIAPVK